MGDESHSIFFVISGQVSLQRHSADGNLITIQRAFENEYFAEASLFSKIYHCDAVASETSHIAAISKAAILDQMNNDQEFSQDITAYFAKQVQDYRRLLELRSIRSAKERVLAGLNEGLHRGSIMSFAPLMGSTHEATYRALNELVRNGSVIRRARGKYLVKKP